MTNNYFAISLSWTQKWKTKTIRFLVTVRSLFYQNTSSARKKLKKKQQQQQKNKEITFTKKLWQTIVPGGGTDLFLTGYNLGTKNRSDKRFSMFYSP